MGRAFETAKKDEGQKKFNFETHTYDSEKNGKLKANGNRAIVENDATGKTVTTSDSKLIVGKKAKTGGTK